MFHVISTLAITEKPVSPHYQTTNCYSSQNYSNNLLNILREESYATVDSGATDHFFYQKHLFTSLYRMNDPIFVTVPGDKAKQKVVHRGVVQFHVGAISITLHNVFYSPSFKVNLLSVSQLTKQGISVTFNQSNALLTSNETGKVITAQSSNNLYIIPIISHSTYRDQLAFNATSSTESTKSMKYEQLLHYRFGHLAKSSIRKLMNNTEDPSNDKVIGLKALNPVSNSEQTDNKCESCLVGKSNRKPFSSYSSDPPATAVMDKLVSDLTGPIKGTSADGNEIEIESLGKNKYLLLVIDTFSRKYFGVLMKRKSDAAENIIQLVRLLQNSTERKLKVFHSDPGGEFKSGELLDYFKDNGTQQTFTTVGTPQHNGKAERAMGTLFGMVRSMLAHCKLPFTFWGAAVTTAIYIRNRTILIRDTNKTSEELFTNNKPTVKHLKVFGCNAYVHQQDRTKLENKTKPGIMIGYGDTVYYYSIYMVETMSIVITRDVDFNENLFTHAQQLNDTLICSGEINYESVVAINELSDDESNDLLEKKQLKSNKVRFDIDNDNNLLNDSVIDEKEIQSDSNVIMEDYNDDFDPDDEFNQIDGEILPSNNTIPSNQNNIPIVSQQNERSSSQLDSKQSNNHSNKHSSKPDKRIVISSDRAKYFKDPTHPTYEERVLDEIRQENETLTRTDNSTNSNSTSGTRKSSRTSKVPPKSDSFDPDMLSSYDRYDVFGDRSANMVFVAMIKSQAFLYYEPENYNQAISCTDADHWESAMDLEFKQLIDNNTWTLVELPANRKPIKCKWVYKIKFNSDDDIEKYKARFVAKGFTQKFGIDYNETFAPVMKYTSLRIILAIATIRDYEIKQFDVETAFLHATVKEEIYVEQPQGFQVKDKEQLVCKLNKSLYGLKQAPNEWNADINNTFVNELHYSRSINDQCVYIKQSKTNQPMIIGLFVDDIISVYSKQDEKEWIEYKKLIETIYKIKDLGDAKWILKMRIERDRKNRTLTLDQESYVNKIINKFNMIDSGASSIPCSTAVKLSKDQCPNTIEEQNEMKIKPYLQLIGSLLYAAISTRIDISYIVARLSRYNSNPGQVHWSAAKRVVRYLKGNNQSKLFFKTNRNHKNDELIVSGYSDSDWAADTDDRKSTTGYIVKLNDCPISWLSKKQAIIAQSSAEAELLALATVTKEIIWTRNFIAELTLQTQLNYCSPIESKIWCDNQAAVQIASNDNTSGKTKHISIRYYFIRDHIKNNEIQLNWISTADQQADILTKPLSQVQFNKFKQLLMIGDSNKSNQSN